MKPELIHQHPHPESSPYSYHRRPSRVVTVGDVGIGGNNPIRIQSMTTTHTMDTEATVAQSVRLARAGSELVRITAPTVEDAANLREIRDSLRRLGIKVPLVADIHFNPRAALEAAKWVEKVRINPGNYADSRTFARHEYTDAEYLDEIERIEERFRPLVLHCKEHGVAMRIGTNHGSLSDRVMSRYGDTPEGMAQSALEFVRICEHHGYRDIILSMKASNPKVMIQAYRLLVLRMDAEGMNYPLHLGVTEAGFGTEARIKSFAGIGALLDDGLGDTIRVSLAEEPELEIPEAKRLADLYTGRNASRRLGPVGQEPEYTSAEPRDPVRYERRAVRRARFGQVDMGGPVIRVWGDYMRALVEPEGGSSLFPPADAQPTAPDLVEVTVPASASLAGPRLASIGSLIAERAPGTPCVVSMEAMDADGLAHLTAASGGLRLWAEADVGPPDPEWMADTLAGVRAAALAAIEHSRPLVLEAREPEEVQPGSWANAVGLVIRMAREAEKAGGPELVLAVRCEDYSRVIRANRLLAARLAERGTPYPILILAPIGVASRKQVPIAPAVAIGSLLCDGIGDAVQIFAERGPREREIVHLAFDCLQAAGARSFKVDLIACPSCGRTLFDLQTTSERIKARLGHLIGVKVAVMGCVVNGPGELADADFGYMGGAPGRVNLYVGKECVEKNVPAEEADERLIQLIKDHGRWLEPAPTLAR